VRKSYDGSIIALRIVEPGCENESIKQTWIHKWLYQNDLQNNNQKTLENQNAANSYSSDVGWNIIDRWSAENSIRKCKYVLSLWSPKTQGRRKLRRLESDHRDNQPRSHRLKARLKQCETVKLHLDRSSEDSKAAKIVSQRTRRDRVSDIGKVRLEHTYLQRDQSETRKL
jgi:hypothetical protein